MSHSIQYTTGLDVGQMHDYTAVAVLERTRRPIPDRSGESETHYAVRHLQRFSPGTPYGDVAGLLASRFADKALAGTSLAVDITGVGQPVLTLLRRSRIGAAIRPVTVTGGNTARPDERGGWLVPKTELVSTLQVLLQQRRLKVAPTLPEAPTLVQELLSFRAKVSASSSESLDDWRENPRDDLVLAVAIAAWIGERAMRRLWIALCRENGIETITGPGG